jgi:hypothetical protein
MAKKNDFSWLKSIGGDGYEKIDESAIKNEADRLVAKFMKEVQKEAKRFKLKGTGALTSEEGYRIEKTSKGGLTTIEIYMIYYGLFQDRGVKGFPTNNPVAEKNAPDSPYQFKHGKMGEDGLESIKNMILRGRAKIKKVKKYKKIKSEKKYEADANLKSKDPVEQQAKQIAYMIKKHGIKTKPFFKNAFEKSFGKLDYALVKASQQEYITKLQIKNKQ